MDIALPAEGVFHNLVFVSIRKTYPMQAYKIMHGLWGMGQMMFTKYLAVVDDVDVHNTSEVLFRLCANTDPQRDSIFTKRTFGNEETSLALQSGSFWNPNGIPSQSPGLRGTSYPGSPPPSIFQPQRGCGHSHPSIARHIRRNHVAVDDLFER